MRWISRRALFGAGAGAAVVVAAGPAAVTRAGDDGSRSGGPSTFGTRQEQTLAAVGASEEVVFFTAGALVANTGSTSIAPFMIYDAFVRGSRPSSGVASVSVNVPLGATITGIEFVMAPGPLAGSVNFYRYTAETVGHAAALFNATVAGTGIVVFASPALNETFDGTQTYEAWVSANNTTTFCKGIRVRYRQRTVPPTGFVPITPARVYDSRLNMVPDGNGRISSGANRTVSVATARNVDTGALLSEVVPPAATSIAFTLTAANTVGGGFLAVNPGGTTAITASTINWVTDGDNVANTGVVKLGGSRQVTVVHGGGGGADFIIDIVGYYL